MQEETTIYRNRDRLHTPRCIAAGDNRDIVLVSGMIDLLQHIT